MRASHNSIQSTSMASRNLLHVNQGAEGGTILARTSTAPSASFLWKWKLPLHLYSVACRSRWWSRNLCRLQVDCGWKSEIVPSGRTIWILSIAHKTSGCLAHTIGPHYFIASRDLFITFLSRIIGGMTETLTCNKVRLAHWLSLNLISRIGGDRRCKYMPVV